MEQSPNRNPEPVLLEPPAPNGVSARVNVLLSSDRPFDETMAQSLLPAMRAWGNCGGNLYDHLTGKHSGLVPKVDYHVSPDGVPDMGSYRLASVRRVDAWLKDYPVQAWLAYARDFFYRHGRVITYDKRAVNVRASDGTATEKLRYVSPFFVEQGWVYYESDFFNEEQGSNSQPHRAPTAFRAYLNPDADKIFKTFECLVAAFGADSKLATFGFQGKTADPTGISKLELSSLVDQKDPIVFYFPRECFASAVRILTAFAQENADWFKTPTVPVARPLSDAFGKAVPGIAFSSEMKGTSPDTQDPNPQYRSFSELQEKILLSCVRSFQDALLRNGVPQAIVTKYPSVASVLSTLPPNCSPNAFVRALLSSPEGEGFFCRNLANSYGLWSECFGLSPRDPAFRKADLRP